MLQRTSSVHNAPVQNNNYGRRRITGLFEEVLLLYAHRRRHCSGNLGHPSFLPSVLKACSSPHTFPLLLQLHASLAKTGTLVSHPATANSLLSVYANCSQVDSARLLFDTLPRRDAVTWNSMINGYIRNWRFPESISLLKEMQGMGLFPAKPELVAMVISVCGRMGNLRMGKEIHAQAICLGSYHASVHVSTALVDMYSRCLDHHAASMVFGMMPERNVVSWTAMITGCLTKGDYRRSLQLLREMIAEGFRPNRATLVTALPACGGLGALRQGKEIHAYIFRHGFVHTEPLVSGALIDMYGRCKGANRLAFLVFDATDEKDVTMWSTTINNSARNGDCVGAMEQFHRMQVEGFKPNSVTMLAVIAACIGLSSGDLVHAVHAIILTLGMLSGVSVANSLIHVYAKCGHLESSVQAFVEMPERDLLTWSTMISGYGIHGRGVESLRLYDEMQLMGVQPDAITLLAVLSACNHSGLVDDGKRVFDHGNPAVLSMEHYACYVDLLGRSGRIEDACEVIKNMPLKPPSVRILTSLVSACKRHGRFEAAIQLAGQLIGVEPGNGANYTLLSMIHAENGDWVGAEEARTVMKERRVRKSYGRSSLI